ncbi:MAG: pilus assembly protein TadG-related protein [Verrucomicrobiota bacterium]
MKLTRPRPARSSRQDGQSMVMFVFFLVVLILFTGLGIDLGFAYITKANLSKAVDAACLEGMLNANQGTVTATAIAQSVFAANYGRPGRDTGTVTPNIVMSFSPLGHRLVTVDATAQINTFFIRILPTWKRLSVKANAQAQQRRLIMSLVLDRSGSMINDRGANVLPQAVTNFVGYFDDANDYVSMNSFSTWGRTDVTIRQNFKSSITATANVWMANLNANFSGNTCSEQGFTNGLAQNQSIVVAPGDDVIKAIIFFTDGLANGFKYTLNCGPRNISNSNGGRPTITDPLTGAVNSNGCTVPSTIPSIDPSYTGKANINTVSCGDMHDEAEARAVALARQARALGNIVYCVGLGNGFSECSRPALNPDFLKDMANTTDSPHYDPTQPVGLSLVADDPSDVQPLFDQIRADILLRLTQ